MDGRAMAEPVYRGTDSPRERGFLAILLLVGGGAVALGAVEVWTQGTASLSAFFDVALGASVLIVTWLFLAPLALPRVFGDPAPGAPLPRRPYLRPVAPPPSARRPTAASVSVPRRDEVQIPKWADPLVVRTPSASPRVPGVVAAESAPVRPIRPAPPPEPSPVPDRWAGSPSPSGDLPRRAEWEDPEPAGTAEESRELALEMLTELDRIEAELRAFSPVEDGPVPVLTGDDPGSDR